MVPMASTPAGSILVAAALITLGFVHLDARFSEGWRRVAETPGWVPTRRLGASKFLSCVLNCMSSKRCLPAGATRCARGLTVATIKSRSRVVEHFQPATSRLSDAARSIHPGQTSATTTGSRW